MEHDDNDDVEETDGGGDGGGGGGGDSGRGGGGGGVDEFGGDIGAHGGLSADAEMSFGLFAPGEDEDEDGDAVFEEAGGDGDDAEPRLDTWAATYEDPEVQRALDAAGYLYVDAHALSTPALADVDGDGARELVVAVSYFIEEESAARLARHGVIIDKNMYVAGGVLALDPTSGRVKWSVHLDLTTELTKLRAYIYSAVTVADLDGDGSLEVAVGTSMGFLYVLDGRSGRLRDGFPVQMNELQAQVVAADVDGDGALELLAADAVGSVAAWRSDGTPLWEVQTSGLCAMGVTLTSLRGDGAVQVVVPTTAGVVHVLEGATGSEVAPFPLRTGGRILSPVLVLNLEVHKPLEAAQRRRAAEEEAATAPSAYGADMEAADADTSAGGSAAEPHLAFMSFDGHLYVVRARTGCYERVDVGEHAYAMVLADDLTSNGRMDLLVSTMNGNVYCFETGTPFAPLRSWRSQAQGRNVWQQREGFQGIAIGGRGGRIETRALSGASFDLEFVIHDYRRHPRRRWHRVLVRLGRSLVLLNKTYYRDSRVAGAAGDEASAVTTHRETLSCPHKQLEGVLTVSMINEHGQYFEDTIAVSFNENFEQVLKWATLLPFAAAVAAIALGGAASRQGATPLMPF